MAQTLRGLPRTIDFADTQFKKVIDQVVADQEAV